MPSNILSILHNISEYMRGTDEIFYKQETEAQGDWLAQGHKATKGQSWDSVPGSLVPRCVLLMATPHCLSIYITSVSYHNNPEGETYPPHFTNLKSEVWEEYDESSLTQGHLVEENRYKIWTQVCRSLNSSKEHSDDIKCALGPNSHLPCWDIDLTGLWKVWVGLEWLGPPSLPLRQQAASHIYSSMLGNDIFCVCLLCKGWEAIDQTMKSPASWLYQNRPACFLFPFISVNQRQEKKPSCRPRPGMADSLNPCRRSWDALRGHPP